MKIPYKIHLHRAPQYKDYYYFALSLPKELTNISAIIIDAGSLDGEKELLSFVEDVVRNTNTTPEYWTNGYTAEISEKDGKKMLKIFFRLTDDYEPSYISPNDFKELLEIWIRERQEFKKNPVEYKEKLKKRGGIIEE